MINELDIVIWGRNFTLPVEYYRYTGESVTQAQIDGLNRFLSNTQLLEQSRYYIDKYCKKAVLADETNTKKDNIFSYIKPEYILVRREDPARVALMCKYKYDLEHGLAVVFTPDGMIIVGEQDIIL